jgi:hypothetical protein
MSRHQFVVLLAAVPGRELELDEWYDNQHLGDVAQVEGVVSAKRFNIDFSNVDSGTPAWRSLALYELEADDPMDVIERIGALSGTDAMPFSESVNMSGLVQLIASPAGVPREVSPTSDPLPEDWSKTEPMANL